MSSSNTTRYFVVGFLLCVLAAVFRFPSSALAEVTCPKTIAYISNNTLSEKVKNKLSNLYTKLGCQTRFVPYPGKRGISLFNKGKVDGELMRIYNMSNEYTRPFIRSALPVHKISMALWTHPDLRRLKGLPTGYTHGIVWQDRYAAKRNFEGMRKFYSRSKMVEAYNMGRLSGIIGTDETIGEFDPLPEQAELLEDFKVYLYVGIEYADFMKKLSVALKP